MSFNILVNTNVLVNIPFTKLIILVFEWLANKRLSIVLLPGFYFVLQKRFGWCNVSLKNDRDMSVTMMGFLFY